MGHRLIIVLKGLEIGDTLYIIGSQRGVKLSGTLKLSGVGCDIHNILFLVGGSVMAFIQRELRVRKLFLNVIQFIFCLCNWSIIH